MNSCFLKRVFLTGFVFLAIAATASAQGKGPVPEHDVQAKAKELIRQIFGPQYEKAKTSDEKTALAKKMLDEAAKLKDDPASHFVLLRATRDVAAQAGNAELSLEVVDQIAATFDFDEPALVEETLREVAGAARTLSQFTALAKQTLPRIEAAVARDDHSRAVRIAELGVAAARRARDYPLAKQIGDRLDEVKQWAAYYAEVQKAQVVLADNPADPDANLTVGRYLCLAQGQWRQGIPLLALGSDAALKALAATELEGPATPGEEVNMADGWWELAQAASGGHRDALLLHAGSWYQKVQADVTGLQRVKVDKRLAEIAEIGTPPVITTVGASPLGLEGAVLVLTFEKHTFFEEDGQHRVKDLSGHGNHGTVHGTRPAPGKAGQGLQFGAKGDFVDCGNADSLNPMGAVTVSAWIMVRQWKVGIGTGTSVVSKDDWKGGPAKGYTLRCIKLGKPDFAVGSPPHWKTASGDEPLPAGQWVHLAGRFDRRAVCVFVNGVQIAAAAAPKPMRQSAYNLIVGRATYDTTRRIDGVIDEVAVFNRPLSNEEIRTLYELGLRGQSLAQER